MDKAHATADAPSPDVELKISNTHRAPRRAQTQQAKNEALAKVANEMRERQAAEAAKPPEEPTAPLPEPREDVESIEWKLLDGRVVVFGPPPGVSLTMRIAMSIPDATTNPVIDRLARVLMSIRSVDGEKPAPIGNIVEMTKLANRIGDSGIDELHWLFERHWGQLRVSDAQLLKKNLR